jgi:hypothetical protein
MTGKLHRKSKAVVYGVFYFQPRSKDGMIIILETLEAKAFVKVWAAIGSAKTWHEFRTLTPRKQYKVVMSWIDVPRGGTRPHGSQPFDPTALSLTSEEWSPLEMMLDWLPQNVLDLGQRADTPGMGDWVSYEPRQEVEVVAALRSAGLTVERDDQLIRRACGTWVDENFTG